MDEYQDSDRALQQAGEPVFNSFRARGWTVAALQVASQGVSIAVLAILYRLIEPAEFGLLNIVVPWLLLARLLSSLGLGAAISQRPDLSSGETSSLFWLNVWLGLASAAILAVVSPAIAEFYGDARLTELTCVLAGTAIVIALGATHQALLERKLQFARLAGARLGAQAIGGAAGIAAALAGWNVWALVLQQYVELAAIAGLAWTLERWRPLRPGRGAAIGGLVRFGGSYTGSGLMYYLSTNVDKILIGKFAGEEALGLYSQAFNLMMRPVYLVTTPLCGVMLPALSRLRSDPAAYRAWLLGCFRLTAVLLLPVGIGLFFTARLIMPVLGGRDWAAAGPMLHALALAITAQGFINIAGSVLASRGRSDRLLYAATILTAIFCIAFGLGLLLGRSWGNGLHGPALGVAWSYTLVLLLASGPYLRYCLQGSGATLADVLTVIRPPAQAAAAMGLAVWLLDQLLHSASGLPPTVQLALEISAGVAVYLLAARKEISWLLVSTKPN